MTSPSDPGSLLSAPPPGALDESSDLDVTRTQLHATLVDRPDAIAHRRNILVFIDEHPDAAHRSCAEAHLTGSAVIVSADGTRALMMLHAKVGRWLQMGGHADGNTNLASVALREASEESGIDGLRILLPAIDVDAHTISHPQDGCHDHLDLRFLVLAPEGAVERRNAESHELRWVAADEVGLLEPAVDEVTAWLIRRALTSAPTSEGGSSAAAR
ncbi:MULTISPECIES: NUDIX hydrolase [Candidatus Microthrix]|jgi:8-oxo-dGTP pyrophosphatase MutT (NUDIX family)|uniref:Putative NTP pyrophosphohydrolases including oxidative damage repair enzymes n=1 Tax=Candidatus Neomicrothrix parvicella RN1 TaxID=1229780 RepID=R4Z3I6_9ACTN|nr:MULTISPECIES: NUDIX hydrolase [Microthrix]MBK7018576.1 NUDIX hydrolase [Candidatus Microthrix sp.]MBK7321960.1 NUDIX hydrolase [Candidatus Microthrix sp.]MBL0205836.1 NUDIX hydrolase [Candidatus Microthrix sp.]MBP6135259.1 NUDIX hydrolase [Candidatus Microthrix sp.]MBP6149780.1 NUDIX hydrolase [Candidatus Microthrix sp.]